MFLRFWYKFSHKLPVCLGASKIIYFVALVSLSTFFVYLVEESTLGIVVEGFFFMVRSVIVVEILQMSTNIE